MLETMKTMVYREPKICRKLPVIFIFYVTVITAVITVNYGTVITASNTSNSVPKMLCQTPKMYVPRCCVQVLQYLTGKRIVSIAEKCVLLTNDD